MKAFLMFRNRDFDPRQILARRERELRYRDTDQAGLDLRQLLPWNEAALTQDLSLGALFNAMAAGDKFLFEAAIVGVLSSVDDPDIILYRQRVLLDCLKNESIVREVYRIAIEAIEQERKNTWSYFARYPSGIVHRSVDVLQMFVRMLKNLRRVADEHAERFASDGFCRLFAMLRTELGDDYFAQAQAHLRRLQFRAGILISAELGKGNKGQNYILRKPPDDRLPWLVRLFEKGPPAYSFQLHPRDEAGARALSALNDQGLNLVGNALARSTDHILSFFQMLRTELAFYVGCLNLSAQLRQLGEPTCIPVPVRAGERKLSFSGLYDLSLALSAGKKVVGNDMNADSKDLFIITGANTGGKSTFLRSIGLANLMMQAGMFVPADSFSSEICNGVFTHYKREEDTTMESGKWDEELSRMSVIIDHIKPNSVMLLNESFASTNEREGSEIASQIVTALLDRNVKVFFVTHLYHFAISFFNKKIGGATFLRAERRSDGTRPFKLVEAGPLQTSYGEDLYKTIFADGEQNPHNQSELIT
jgi:DNA mismatch repair ATPase MutS